MPPMKSDREVWRMARTLVEWYGPRAASIAAKQASELLRRNDMPGHRSWMRVFTAISEFQRAERRPGEGVS